MAQPQYPHDLGTSVPANTPEADPVATELEAPAPAVVIGVFGAWPSGTTDVGLRLRRGTGEPLFPRNEGFSYADGVAQNFPLYVAVDDGEALRAEFTNQTSSEEYVPLFVALRMMDAADDPNLAIPG